MSSRETIADVEIHAPILGSAFVLQTGSTNRTRRYPRPWPCAPRNERRSSERIQAPDLISNPVVALPEGALISRTGSAGLPRAVDISAETKHTWVTFCSPAGRLASSANAEGSAKTQGRSSGGTQSPWAHPSVNPSRTINPQPRLRVKAVAQQPKCILSPSHLIAPFASAFSASSLPPVRR